MPDATQPAQPPDSGPSKGLLIASWITRLIVVGIFAMGAIPKFTGNATVLQAAGLPGGDAAIYAIGAAEATAIVLLLVPKTALIGAGLATIVMLGAVGSHLFGPVGMEGDAGDMLPLAITALLAAVASGVLLIVGRGAPRPGAT